MNMDGTIQKLEIMSCMAMPMRGPSGLGGTLM
jgi:hypothetical protein